MAGWEPREFTEYHYDGDRLIGSVTTREPEFDSYQAALLMAVSAHDNNLGPHNQPLAEAMDPQADPAAPGGWHYEANQKPRIDWAQRAIDLAREAFYEQYPKANRAGHVWYTKRVDD